MFPSVLFTALPVILPVVLAQDSGSGSFTQSLIDHLNTLGNTEVANALTKANGTSTGQQWLSKLQSGNYTVFVPNNAAFQNLSGDISGNDELLSQALSYHFVHGNFQNTTANSTSGGGGAGGGGMTSSASTESSSTSGSTSSQTSSESSSSASATQSLLAWYRRQDEGGSPSGGQTTDSGLLSGISPNHTIGRTLLNSSSLVMLEGNKSQVLAWTRYNATANVTIINQATNITVTNSSLFQNLYINTIDGVLTPPGNLTQALSATNATQFLALAQQANITSPSGENTTVSDALSSARGVTLFVPSNDAFQTAQQIITELQGNSTVVTALLANHAINGTTVYSPDLQNATASGSNATYITAAGEMLSVSSNETGLFVQNMNGSSAQIIRPDVLTANGVFHIIDNVLVETDSNPEQASSAVLSASSAASALSSTDTLPIGGGYATLTSSMASSSTESSSQSTPSETSSSSSSSESSSSPTSSSTQLSRIERANDASKFASSPLTVTILGALVWIFAL